MNLKSRTWTVRYTLLNSAYFVAFCTIHAYAAVYLLDHGFTNTQIGILLSVANITSAVCQPVVAGLIDKPGPITNRNFILFSVILILLGSLVLMAVQDNMAVIFIVYALIYMVQFTYQPVMTALCFEYQKKGCSIVYGLSRGLGSASFAVTSALIGGVVEKRGVFVLLILNVAAMAVSAVVILLFRIPKGAAAESIETSGAAETAAETAEETPHNNLREFAQVYPAYTLFLLGAACFFFAHNMINDYMIQIIRNLGGAETQMGYAAFLQAILELPVMAGIGFILRKVSAKNLLILSGAAFLVKTVILVFAKNMAGLYISQSFQMLAYAVFIPAAAYYVSETMKTLDQVKGQAFITTAITVGGIFSNFICGRILDSLGVHPMLITGAAVNAVGVVIAFIAMKRLPDVSEKAKIS